MASYSQFFGRIVTVQYRLGSIVMPAQGTIVGDSGRSIFLEQHQQIRGRVLYFRWEIPYSHIHKLEDGATLPANVPPESTNALPSHSAPPAPAPIGLAARASAGSSFLPIPGRPKTA